MKKETIKQYIINELQFQVNDNAWFEKFGKNKNIRKFFAYAIFLDSTILRSLGEKSWARNVLAHTKSAEFLNDISVKPFLAYCQDYFSDDPMPSNDFDNTQLIKKLESISERERVQQLLSIMNDLIQLLNIKNPSTFEQAAILVDSMRLGEIQFHITLMQKRQNKLEGLKKQDKNVNYVLDEFNKIRDTLAHPEININLTCNAFIQQQFSLHKEKLYDLLAPMNKSEQAVDNYYEGLIHDLLNKANKKITRKNHASILKQKFQLLKTQYHDICDIFDWAESELQPRFLTLPDNKSQSKWNNYHEANSSLRDCFKKTKKDKLSAKKIEKLNAYLDKVTLGIFLIIYYSYLEIGISDIEAIEKIFSTYGCWLQKSLEGLHNKKEYCPLIYAAMNSFSINPELTYLMFKVQQKIYKRTDAKPKNIEAIYLLHLFESIRENFKSNISHKMEISLGYFFDVFYIDLNKMPITPDNLLPGLLMANVSTEMLRIFLEKYPLDVNRIFKLTHNVDQCMNLIPLKDGSEYTFFTLITFHIEKLAKEGVDQIKLILDSSEFDPSIKLYADYSETKMISEEDIFSSLRIRLDKPSDFYCYDLLLQILSALLTKKEDKIEQSFLHQHLDELFKLFLLDSHEENFLNYIKKSITTILLHDAFQPNYCSEEQMHILKYAFVESFELYKITLLSFLKRDPSAKLLFEQLTFEIPVFSEIDLNQVVKLEQTNVNTVKRVNSIAKIVKKNPEFFVAYDKRVTAYSSGLNLKTSASKHYHFNPAGKLEVDGVILQQLPQKFHADFNKMCALTDEVYTITSELLKVTEQLPKVIEKQKGIDSNPKLHELFTQKIQALEEKQQELPKKLYSILAMPGFEPEVQPTEKIAMINPSI